MYALIVVCVYGLYVNVSAHVHKYISMFWLVDALDCVCAYVHLPINHM